MGGPACQGKMMPKVEEVIADDRTSKGMAFSKTQINIVCPWHGFEFDMRTGRHVGYSPMRLRGYPVKVRDGAIYVVLPAER
jgi:nitrite reductase/ring-hydroxylating ferredoxin subunit